jgi:hypothetical protein
MKIDLILETISTVATNTKYGLADRIMLIENLLKFANTKAPKDTTRESE